MKKLDKMLIREIVKTRWQFIATAAVIFAGIVIFSSTVISYRNLKGSMDYSYEKYKFLDYYAETIDIKIPEKVLDQVKELPGVSVAMGRISMDVSANVKDDKRVQIRILSVPDERRPEINDLFVFSGQYLDNSDENSCLISSRFGKYHKLVSGDTIKTNINSKEYSLKINGLVSGPEFFKLMKSPTSFFDSEGDFGLVFIKQSKIESVLGNSGKYNQLHVLFRKEADTKSIVKKIEDILKPYGLMASTERTQQLSNIMISDDVKQVKDIATIMPIVFLLVAAAIIYIMQRRIISNQRIQIGSMKAMGYGNKVILWHYLKYSLFLSIVGSIPAVFTGQILGKLMSQMYLKIYDLSERKNIIYFGTFFIAIGLSILFSMLGGYSVAKRILKIEPAQAMSSEVPKAGKRIFLERINFFWRRLPFGWKVSIRNIFRSRQRALLTVIGFIFTVILFLSMMFLLDTTDYFINLQFKVVQKQDYSVDFKKPLSYEDALDIGDIDNISKLEPVFEVKGEISKGSLKKLTKVIGIDKNSTLYRFIDKNGDKAFIPNSGILIASSLARKLSIKTGDIVDAKYFFGQIKEGSLKVAGIIKQGIGFDCYMDLSQLTKQLEIPKMATGVLVKVSTGANDTIEKELLKNVKINTIENRKKILDIVKTFIRLIYIPVGFMILFSVIMGFAIIFNTTAINLTERKRELASLKVMGYKNNEIGRIIFRENMILGIIALLPGILIGRLLCGVIAPQINSRVMLLEAVIYPRTYIITCISVFLYIMLAQLTIKKSIKKLDMVSVLKDREG